MENILDKMFYLFYSITKHTEKKFQATVMLALGAAIFISTIDYSLFLFNIDSIIKDSEIVMIGIFIFFGVTSHYYFNYNKRYKKIAEKYKNINRKDKNKIIIIVSIIYGGMIIIDIVLVIIENNYW